MRDWLKILFNDSYLPALQKLHRLKPTTANIQKAQALCVSMREDWAKRGKKKPTQQKPLMDEIRKAIKDEFSDESWLLDHIRLTREEYFEINQQNSAIARSKQMQQQYITDPDSIVAQAVRLLESPEWKDIACALAVLTGRRLNEVLKTAEFTIKSQWVVTFKGALKRRGEEVELVFDIPTLTTAQRVVDAIAKLRQITPTDANEAAIAEVSDRHFAGLIPAPPTRGKLYAHLWRSVYACIATFFYCPKHCDDLLYKAHILGHFQTLSQAELTDEGLMRARLETFASDRHYRLYEIDDEVIGKHYGKRKGIRLGFGGVEVLDAFKEAMPEEQPQVEERQQVSNIRVWQEDKERIYSFLEQLEIVDGNLQERMGQLCDWIEDQLDASAAVEEDEPIDTLEVTDAEDEAEIGGGADGVQEDEGAIASSVPESSMPEESPVPSSLESRLDRLVDTMSAFMQLQMQLQGQQGQGQAVNGQSRQRQRVVHQNGADGEGAVQEGPQRRGRGEVVKLVHGTIDQIMAWNDAEGRLHDEKWAITINALKAAGASQHAILKVMEDRRGEIDAHHERHQIDPDKHNLKHRGKRSVQEVLNV